MKIIVNTTSLLKVPATTIIPTSALRRIRLVSKACVKHFVKDIRSTSASFKVQ